MRWRLAEAAQYFHAKSKLHPPLRKLLSNIARVFNFVTEHQNRMQRFVRVVQDYKDGMPVRDIETKYGCSRQTILRYARLAGLPKRPKPSFAEKAPAALALLDQNKPLAEIAARLGTSQAWVSYLAKAHGKSRYPRKAK